jgi:hypothetical protein
MTTINPYYGTYLPPTPPPEEPPLPPPPVVIGADGRPREPEVIIVIGQRTDPYRHLMPYRGLTGGAENSRRDMEMAMAGPEDRARMLGMDPNASIGIDEGSATDEWGVEEIGTIRTVPFSNKVLEGLGVNEVELSNRVANHIIAKHSIWWPGNSELPNLVSDAASLQSLIVAPALTAAHRVVFNTNGTMSVYADLPLVGRDALGLPTNTYKLTLGPAQSSGNLRIITAFPVIAGSGRN